MWSSDTAVREKIQDRVENLWCTAAYAQAAAVPVWVNDEGDEEILSVVED